MLESPLKTVTGLPCKKKLHRWVVPALFNISEGPLLCSCIGRTKTILKMVIVPQLVLTMRFALTQPYTLLYSSLALHCT